MFMKLKLMGGIKFNTQSKIDKWLNEETAKSFSELAEMVERKRKKRLIKKENKRNKNNNQTQLLI